jgi:hypothetical protein
LPIPTATEWVDGRMGGLQNLITFWGRFDTRGKYRLRVSTANNKFTIRIVTCL